MKTTIILCNNCAPASSKTNNKRNNKEKQYDPYE